MHPWMLTVLAFAAALLHATGFLAAVHALLTARSSQAAIAWTISLVTFPYVSLPLYLLLRRNRFEGYVQAFRAGRLHRGGVAAEASRRPLLAHPAHVEGAQSDTIRVLENLARVPFTGANRAQLLIDGEASYRAMFEAISEARQYVLVLFFIVNDDTVGRKLQACLLERARAGVKVCFVYDELGSWRLTRRYLQELRAGGVEVHVFSSEDGRNRLQFNFRNHRKIVVVDGRVALVGGLNVGDEQLGTSRRYGPWRDTHVRIEGPAAQTVQLVFQEDYHWASGGRLLDLDWHPTPTPATTSAVYLASGPADPIEVGLMYFLHFINSARHRLWISSPYFVPDAAVLQALKLADLRGVQIRILLPRRYDRLYMHLAALSYMPELATETTIEVYLYPDYCHQKVILVDDWLCSVGSSNLDNRSMRLNFEGNMVIADRHFAADVESMLVADFDRASRLSPRESIGMSLPVRIGARLCRLLDPIL